LPDSAGRRRRGRRLRRNTMLPEPPSSSNPRCFRSSRQTQRQSLDEWACVGGQPFPLEDLKRNILKNFEAAANIGRAGVRRGEPGPCCRPGSWREPAPVARARSLEKPSKVPTVGCSARSRGHFCPAFSAFHAAGTASLWLGQLFCHEGDIGCSMVR